MTEGEGGACFIDSSADQLAFFGSSSPEFFVGGGQRRAKTKFEQIAILVFIVIFSVWLIGASSRPPRPGATRSRPAPAFDRRGICFSYLKFGKGGGVERTAR